MSLRLLVDEDCQAAILVRRLREAGHDVRTVHEAGFAGKRDAEVFAYARAERRLMLTHNCDDFRALHEEEPDHAGILALYEYDQASKNLTYGEVVQAIENLQAGGWDLAGQFVALNAWSFTGGDEREGDL